MIVALQTISISSSSVDFPQIRSLFLYCPRSFAETYGDKPRIEYVMNSN